VLNPAFSADVARRLPAPYVLPGDIIEAVLSGNSDYDTGRERRLQRVYEDELWRKLERLGAPRATWEGQDVLDAACGTGFLAYHLLARARPASLTLADISTAELDEAEALLRDGDRAPADLRAVECDLTRTPFPDASFDVVVGNSFLHHLPSVPAALTELRRILRPGGRLVVLHEPTPPAFALESGRPLVIGAYAVLRRRFIRRIRHPGPGPVREDSGDVWIFERDDLLRLMREAGFATASVEPWHLARSVVVGALGLHLSEQRPQLTPRQERLVGAAIRFDDAASHVVPAAAFGSLSVLAQRSRGDSAA
jgi:ubiquinone/menaquinone biosynthesis C-methylase UbiE